MKRSAMRGRFSGFRYAPSGLQAEAKTGARFPPDSKMGRCLSLILRSRAARPASADDTIQPFEVFRPRFARGGSVRRSMQYSPATIIRRSRSCSARRCVLAVLLGSSLKFEANYSANPNRRASAHACRRFHHTRPGPGLRGFRREIRKRFRRGRAGCGRDAWAWASRMTIDQGGHEPLSGSGGAGGRNARGCGARIFPAARSKFQRA